MMLNPEYVYFVQAETTRDVKIGYTWCPRQRLKAVSRSCRSPLKVLAVVPGGRRLEREWHLRFAHLRLDGEWFRPDPELLAAIDRSVAADDGREP